MKKKLLKPPKNNAEILCLPQPEEILLRLKKESVVGTAHQPYFFNPGVSLKFLFLENLPQDNKQIIFIDTDRIYLKVKVFGPRGAFYSQEFINDPKVLYNYPAPNRDKFLSFFSYLENELNRNLPDSQGILNNFSRFKDILAQQKKKYLKEILAESFLEYYGLKRNYWFMSELIVTNQFKDFFIQIYKDDRNYRAIFNSALDDYKQEYKFRYHNFPFPKLKDKELPFWIIRGGLRQRCFKSDFSLCDYKKYLIFPRASTLTMFLRLYKLNLFIHGVGGANYEWINDRVIEKFFTKSVAPYAVVSGTFLLKDSAERDLPYFFFSPENIKESIDKLIMSSNQKEAN